MHGAAGEKFQSIINSKTGEQLAKTLDINEIEKAVHSGDTKVLSALLKSVLETPEGKTFAEQVRKTVNNGQ